MVLLIENKNFSNSNHEYLEGLYANHWSFHGCLANCFSVVVSAKKLWALEKHGYKKQGSTLEWDSSTDMGYIQLHATRKARPSVALLN